MGNATGGNAYVPGGGGGAAISAGGASQNTGTIVFSNLNGVTFGLNNGVITATVTPGAAAGIAAVQAGTQTQTSGTMVFANSNNMTFGLSGSSQLTASFSTNIGIAAAAAGTQTGTSGSVVFANSNGMTFGMSGSSQITASYTVPAATVFSNSNNVTFGLNASTITASANPGVSAISAGTTSVAGGQVVLSNSNGVTFGLNGSTVTASYNSTSAAGQGTTFAGTNVSASMTLNTAGLNLALSAAAGGGGSPNISAGTTSGNLGSIVFSNSNGVSFGLNGSTITASASGAGASATVLAQSQTTGQSSSGTLALSALNVAGYGIVSVGMSAGTLQISGPGTTNFANLSVSAGTTSGSLGSIVFSNSNGVSFGLNGSTLTASAAAGGGGAAISAGTQSTNGNTVVFSNSNNVSFGMSNSSVVTASFSASQVSSIGLYALGNTTQNSSTTLDQRTLSFNGLGAMTVGFSNGGIQMSAPATSSMSATGAVSISTNGSTISIGAPNYGTLSYWDNGILNGSASSSALGLGSVALQAVVLDANLSVSALRQFISVSLSATNSSFGNSLSFQAGIYTRNGSTLSLASSGSASYAMTNTSTASSASYAGIRGVTVPLAASMTPGNYWIALWSSTASSGFNMGSFSNVVAANGAVSYSGALGVVSNASNQVALGGGVWSTTSASLPSSIAFSAITGSVGNIAPYVNLYNVSA